MLQSQPPQFFHSSDVDDTSALPFGWYIGHADATGTQTANGALGPYRSETDARKSAYSKHGLVAFYTETETTKLRETDPPGWGIKGFEAA